VHRLSIIGKKDRKPTWPVTGLGPFLLQSEVHCAPSASPEALGSLFTGMADMSTGHDTFTSAVHERLFGDLKLFEPKAMYPFIAVRDRQER
jgi:hypothetical protein